MPRTNQSVGSQNQPPDSGDQRAVRHWGDGFAGTIHASRMQGFFAGNADYRDVAVDANGNLQLAANVSVDLGTVDQGNAGSSAWLVDVQDRSARLLGHVTVDNASMPTTQSGAWSVSVSNFPATQPVSGPLTDTQLRASRVPVDGSGVTQPVSGTFWQATQPVSGPLTDSQLRASAVPVSGTFWQATQPVSIAAALDIQDRSARLLGHITVDNATLAATQSGTWTVQQGGAPWSVNFPSAQHVIVDSGTENVTIQNASLPVTQSGAWVNDISDRAARQLGVITNTGFAVTGTDGVTAGLAPTVKAYNGSYKLFVRDEALLGLVSELLAEIRLLNNAREGVFLVDDATGRRTRTRRFGLRAGRHRGPDPA